MNRRASGSFVVETKIPIPERRPPAVRIVRAVACPFITRSTAINRKVIVWGHVHVDLEYVAEQPAHTEPIMMFAYDCPISICIDYHKARENLEATLAAKIEFQHYDLENDRIINTYIVGSVSILGLRRKTIINISHSCEVVSNSILLKQERQSTVPQMTIRRTTGWNAWNRKFRR